MVGLNLGLPALLVGFVSYFFPAQEDYDPFFFTCNQVSSLNNYWSCLINTVCSVLTLWYIFFFSF